MIELTWDAESGEGAVHINKDFVLAHRIVQLDALTDWIAELQELYNLMLEKP
jgi:hypothetical protein